MVGGRDHGGPNYFWAQALDVSRYYTGLPEGLLKWKSLIEHRPSNRRTEGRVLLILAGGIPEDFL